MKHAIALLAVGVASSTLTFAQGHLLFANFGGGVNAPFYEADGVTRLAGPAYVAGLWFATATNVTDPGQLVFSTITQPFSSAPGGAGYFLGGARDMPGTYPGQIVSVQVRAWRVADGADFTTARGAPGGHWGMSNIFPIGLDSGTTAGAYFFGLRSLALTVNAIPEPSVLALAVLGGTLLVLFRRKTGKRR